MTEKEKQTHFLGKYELIEKLGSGGMAEVFKARLSGAGGFEKIVVVKRILPGYSKNTSFIRMLIEEAKLTSVLQHPNIVQIFELGDIDGQYYIVMEFVDGKDLLKILARCAEKKRRIPIEIAAFIVSEVCKGLDFAHNAKDFYGKPLNIIHRDISPSNVMVSKAGHIKIMDFGVAKALTEDTRGSRYVLRGKLGYMSPEQVRGEDLDPRSDIFSLGIVFLEAITLKRLFLGRTDLETLINIRDADISKKFKKYPFIDEDLKAIITKALAKDRDKRFTTALEFHTALQEYLFKRGKRITNSDVVAFLASLFGQEFVESAAIDASKRAEEVSAPEPMVREVTRVEKPAADDVHSPVLAKDTTSEAAIPAATPTPKETSVPTTISKKEPDSRRIESVELFVSAEDSPIVGMEPSPISSQLKGHEFTLKNTKGYTFKAVSYENLVNLIQTGAVSEEEFVSIDGGEWKKIKEITSMRRLSPNAALRSRGITPTYSGSTSMVAMPRLFHRIISRKLSGKLRFLKRSAQKEFYFFRGKPKHIASNLKHELLGPFMLKRGVISQEQMAQAIEKAAEFGGRLGDSVVSLGFLKPHELYWLLEQQFKEKFMQIFQWKSAGYEFYENVPAPVEMAPAQTNTYYFIMEGLRKHVPPEEIQRFLDPYKKVKLRIKKTKYLKPEDIPLNSRESKLLAALQRYDTFDFVIRSVCKNPEDIASLYRLLLILYETELLTFQSGKKT